MSNLQKEIVDTLVTPDQGLVEDLQLIDDLSKQPQPKNSSKDSAKNSTKDGSKLEKEIVDTVVKPTQKLIQELTDELAEVITAGLSDSLQLEGSSNALNQSSTTGGDEVDYLGPGGPPNDGNDENDDEQSTPSFSPTPKP